MQNESHPDIIPSTPEARAALRPELPQHDKPSKLRSLPPIGEDDDEDVPPQLKKYGQAHRRNHLKTAWGLKDQALKLPLDDPARPEMLYAANLHIQVANSPGSLNSVGLLRGA